ncbi:MAG: Crp/Fnr family transcriptional regulator [Pseudomonas sp.]|uniref:Crp/Fnr family transcriptional regulator n=1 Tax=Pseudomonas sp. TaxID=306 RepID=UPI00339B7988
MLTNPSIIQLMQRHHLFSRLPEKTLHEVCALANLKRLACNEPLMHQGDSAERFFLLISGQVKLHRVTSEGQEKLVEVIQHGQSFAEALLFTEMKRYPVSATALKDSVLVSIDGAHYRHLLEEQPKICLDILAGMSIHLHRRLREIDLLTQANASRRVVGYLFQERDPRSDLIHLQVPKRLVASRLGIQPETFSRILHRLVDSGLISMERRNIRILDEVRLADYHQ